MFTVDSPLEALAFNYVNFGILSVVNNLWAWIAVVTAAFSYWRIRATSSGDSSSLVKLGHCSVIFEEICEKSERETVPIKGCETQLTAAPVAETTKPAEVMCDCGMTKGKLTVYYHADDEGHNDDGKLTTVSDGGNGEVEEWWQGWERVVRTMNGEDDWYRNVDLTVFNGNVVRTMNGEDGWYRNVDLTVFNGNVVRLWDDNGVRQGTRCVLVGGLG